MVEGSEPVVHVPGLMSAQAALPSRCPTYVMAQPLILKKWVQTALFVLPTRVLNKPQSKAYEPTAGLVVSWITGFVGVATWHDHHHWDELGR